MRSVLKIEHKHIKILVNALVFLFFITVLAFDKGYNYAPIMLMGMGIIYLFIYLFKFKKKLKPTQSDKWLIFAFVFYFATFALSAVIHGDGFREIDNPSKVLFFLPLLLLFRDFPINPKVILHGIPLGAAVAGFVAIYQKFELGINRAFTSYMAIQGGDIAMSLGLFSLAIAIYFGIKKQYIFMTAYILCACLGILASFLSGSRGGWIALPISILMLFYFWKKFLNKKLIFTMGLFPLLVIVLIMTPQTNIKSRLYIAKHELSNYYEKNMTDSSVGIRLEL